MNLLIPQKLQKRVRRNAVFSYFDFKTAIKSFMVGTYNNDPAKNNVLTHYDDLETCNNIFQKGCKMTNIQCKTLTLPLIINFFSFLYIFQKKYIVFVVENKIIGYQLAYIDILNKSTIVKRLANNYKNHKTVQHHFKTNIYLNLGYKKRLSSSSKRTYH